jgi:AcrR family transcriptional regulator
MLTLAEEQGYEATTIDQVAARADVGTSTVYRYYPTKDAILLGPATERVGVLVDAFRARPAEEDVRVSLAYALQAVLARTVAERDETRRLRAQLDISPGPRARLFDLWHRQRLLLEAALTERLGAEADPVWVSAAAHLTLTVQQMALDHDRESDDEEASAYAERVLQLLHGASAPLPAALGPELPA